MSIGNLSPLIVCSEPLPFHWQSQPCTVGADPVSMSGTNVRIVIAKDIFLKNVQYRIDASCFIANITGVFVVIFAEVCSSVRTNIKSFLLQITTQTWKIKRTLINIVGKSMKQMKFTVTIQGHEVEGSLLLQFDWFRFYELLENSGIEEKFLTHITTKICKNHDF